MMILQGPRATGGRLNACQDLLKYDSSGRSWPASMVATIQKYLRFMSIQFGAQDEDVSLIRSKLEMRGAQQQQQHQQQRRHQGNNKKKMKGNKKTKQH